MPRASRLTTAKLTQEKADEIRDRLRSGRSLLREIAKEFGISMATASKIKLGQAWVRKDAA